MPGSWDPQVYRARAQQWRDEAEKMPLGDTRNAYITISEGYANLPNLIERDGQDRSIRGFMGDQCDNPARNGC
jgi:hypothetical protein